MDRFTRSVIAAAAAVVLAGCGEPFVVLGDAPGVMRIVLGVGNSIGTTVDSLAVRTRLTAPTGIAFDAASGVLYVADRGAVRQVNGITTPVARIFSVTSRGRSTLLLDAGGCSSGTCIVQVTAMALAPDGSLIIADQAGNRVFRYVPAGALNVIAGNGTPATAADGQPAASSPISRPAGVAVGTDGAIYIAEAGGHRVRRIDSAGLLQTVAGTGSPGHSGDGGAATAADLNEPAALVLRDGVLFISDVVAHVVRRVAADGTIATLAGVPGARGYSGDGGAAVDAALDRPVSLALTPDARQLFISDEGNNRVRVIDLPSGSIRTFAGTGDIAWSGERKLAGETSLFRPAGIDAAANGFLFVVDSGHSVVWRTSVGNN
jgi:DNA-binding beta-propeller fold protein YncE